MAFPSLSCIVSALHSDRDHCLSYDHAVRNLKSLKEYADTKNIGVVLENLRFGLARAPEPHKYILENTGCRACLDIGHASNSRIILSHQMTCEDYIKEMGETGKAPLFIGIDKVKFLRKINPGDTLEIHSKMVSERREKSIVTCFAEVFVNDELSAVGEVTLAMR